MKKKPEEFSDEIRPEYDFNYSKAERGKYNELLEKGSQFLVSQGDYTKEREKWLKDISLDDAISQIKNQKKLNQTI